MVRFTHVLYPTDLSDAAAPGLGYALSLARWYQARLTVLHVVPTFEAVPMPPGAIGELTHLLYPPPKDAVLAEIRRALDLDALTDITPDVQVVEGDASPAILDRALTTKADLVVMGTHGRRGFDRLLHGSVTGRVLQRASCPVLTVPPHAVPAPHDPIFTRILCPIDFSPASQQAYGFALDLASQSNGAVTALHVVDWLAEGDPVEVAAYNAEEYRQYVLSDAETRLRTFAEAEPHDWCDVVPTVRSGRSHRAILQVATDMSANLIVMGAHGRGALGTAIYGSTAHEVIRAAACPVLVVRG